MKSEHTSTNCKQNNSILLCATGRCGSNYIMSTISSDPNIFNLGEFFNYKSIWNLYIKMHTLSLMSQKRSDLIFNYKDWLTEMAGFFKKNLNNLFLPDHQVSMDELDRFMKPLNEELFNTTLKFINQELKKDTVTKIFMYNIPRPTVTTKEVKHLSYLHVPEISNINVEKVLSSDCDNLIVTYRENILSTYISEMKANINNIWYVSQYSNIDRLSESQDLKIEWNKENYLRRCKSIIFWNNKLYKLYQKFNKNKCIVSYETLHQQENKLQYLQEIYNKNKMNIKTNKDTFDPTIRQSKDKNIEDNFTNPEEFLRDYDEIKDTVCYKMAIT